MASSFGGTNDRRSSKDSRRDSSGLSSIFMSLPRAAFDRTTAYHPRQREPRRSSLINLSNDRASTAEQISAISQAEAAEAINQSAASTRFFESCIELYVHKIVASVMLDRVDDDVLDALVAQNEVSEEIDDVQAELDEVREKKADLIPMLRRNTVALEHVLDRPDGTTAMPPLIRCRTTDGASNRRPVLPSQTSSSRTLPISKSGDLDTTNDKVKALEDILASETSLKTIRRELLDEHTDLATQIARLQWQAQGSGMMRRSFQRVQAKVRQRQKEQWLELAEMIIREEKRREGNGKAKVRNLYSWL